MTLAKDFLDAALKIAAARPGRNVPSPSSVMRCTRQNWFKAHDVPRTFQPDNGESFISAESGRASEPTLLEIACFMLDAVPVFAPLDEDSRELDEEELSRISMKGGQVDNVLRLPDGELVLVEFKRKGIFGILDLLRKDVREAEEEEWIQMQVLMAAKGLKRGLYVAANWDRGAFTSHSVGRYAPKAKKGGERPDAVDVEWVEYSEAAVTAARQRAEMQTRYIEGEEDPARVPRDYNPNDERFPCTWCPQWTLCKEVG
jgi:hypothetical protein